MTTESILETLRNPDHELPKEALAEVIRRREEFVPLLISALNETARLAAERPEEVDGENCLPSFAVLLLAQFREATAVEAVFAVFNMPDEVRHALFGEVFSLEGARILATLCSHNPETLQQCAKRETLEPYGRWAVFQALAVQAAWGEFPVEELVQFFDALFDSNAYGDDAEVWTYLVSVCMDFCPEPFLNRIRALYDRHLIDSEIVGDIEDVEASAEDNAEELRGRYAESHPPIEDTAEEVAWWPQFNSIDELAKDTLSILEALRYPDELPEKAVAEVVRRREEFAPLLILALEDAVGLAMENSDDIDEEDCLPATAVLLLAQFREASATEIVLKALQLPEEIRHGVFGQIWGFEQSSRILATLCSKNPEALEQCAKRESLDPTDRWSVLEALALQASWKQRPTKDVVDFFAGLLDANTYGDDADAWSYLVSVCVEFGCQPFLDRIRALYSRNLVDVSLVGDLEEVEAHANDDPAKLREEYAETMPPIDDTTAELSASDRFNSEAEWMDDDDEPARGFVPPPDSPPAVPIRAEPKIGRNDPCPCGSGKKYKKCCMKT